MKLEEQYDRIFRYLYFRLQDHQTAEDLTQETFLRFLASRTYRDENRQLQYLYTIARNLCIQHYRDRDMTFSLEETQMPQVKGSFEESLIRQISLREAMDKLPPEEREMLFLHYVNDVPVPVTGDEFDPVRFREMGFYKLRRQKIEQRMEKQASGGKMTTGCLLSMCQ